MNTNIKTTLSNLLAPITGSNRSGNGQNGALIDSGGKNVNNGEFEAIVRKIKSRQEKSEQTNSSQADSNKKPKEDVVSQSSATHSQTNQNKPVKEKTDASEIETVLSEIAALVRANPEQFQDPEVLKSTIEELLPENSGKLQEINDFLASLQQTLPISGQAESTDITPQNGEEAAENIVEASVPAENAEVLLANNPELSAETAQPDQTTASEKPGDASQQITPETATKGTDQAGQTLPQNQGQAGETLTQGDTAKTTDMPRSDLNSETPDQSQPDTQSNTSSGQDSKGTGAERLLEMVQDTKSETAANETPLRQMNLSPEQILTKEAETQKTPISPGNFKAELDVMEQANSDNTPIEKSETDTSSNTFNASPVKTTESSNADIARQIQESMTTSYRADTKQVVVRLDPPELGKVTIQFIEKSDGITGVLQVDQAQTRQDIERALPEIIQNLQNAGVQVKKVEVVLTAQQQGYDTAREESAFSGQEGGFDRQNNPHSSSHHTGYHEPSGNFENFSQSTQSDMQMTEKSINMLI